MKRNIPDENNWSKIARLMKYLKDTIDKISNIGSR